MDFSTSRAIQKGHDWLPEPDFVDPHNLDHDGADFCTKCGLVRYTFMATENGERDPVFANDSGILTLEQVLMLTEKCQSGLAF